MPVKLPTSTVKNVGPLDPSTDALRRRWGPRRVTNKQEAAPRCRAGRLKVCPPKLGGLGGRDRDYPAPR